MPVAADQFVVRDYYPLVGVTDTLVLVFAEHGSSALRPNVELTALEAGTVAVIKSGQGLDTSLFTLTETITLSGHGSKVDRPLPITAGATINTVTAVTVTRGKVAVTVNSPMPFRSYLQQPTPNPPLN